MASDILSHITVIDVLAWTCAILFVVTGIITILALIGWVRLGGGDEANAQYFLRRLFVALLLEVIAGSVSAYVSYNANLLGPYRNAELIISDLSSRVTRLETPTEPDDPTPPVSQTKWELVRTGDCGGRDVNSSGGPLPQEAICNDPGLTAICWDGATYRNGDTAWCTYKQIDINQCTGGSATGIMYKCTPRA